MNISVIIPSYNTQDTIETTLQHLICQNINVEYEIIVVDCSEHNKISSIINKLKNSFSNLHYIHQKHRFNPGEGRNIGARTALGELLVFVDSDVLLSSSSLQAAWNHFLECNQIFGGSLELNTRINSNLSAYVEHFFFNHESQKRRPVCERKNLSSALICFDKIIFLNAGGFKDIPRMQDTELTERLRKQGYRLYFFPDILGFQTQDSPFSKVLMKIFINGQNIYYIRYNDSPSIIKKIFLLAGLPLITIVKTGRIIFRHILYQNLYGKLVTLVISLPLCFSGFFWMAGIYNAIIIQKGISRDR